MLQPTSHFGCSPFYAALVIPTGLGASQGGYGGDASVWLNGLASVCDGLITHPNVANAAAFQRLPANAWYCEGYWLDAWFAGEVALLPPSHHRIGVLLDAGMEAGMAILQRNTIEAVKTVYGCPLVAVAETDAPLDIAIELQPSGASGGCWRNPEAAIAAGRRLMETHGITALAIATRMVEPEDSVYSEGSGVDPIGGLEAIISHTLSHALGIPCANAPVFDWEEAQPRRDALVSPLVASEYVSATFLPCVLTGLTQAPRPVSPHEHPQALGVEGLNLLVLPLDCFGGVPALAAVERGIPILCVRSNETVLNVTAEAVFGETKAKQLRQQGRLFEVANYLEAIGFMALYRQGVQCPLG